MTAVPPVDGIPAALAEPTRRVGPRWIAFISLGNLALWMGYFGPLQVLLPEQLAAVAPEGKESALAWVTGAGAAVAMLATPVAGALSDRTAGRLGRRHPWTLGGAVAGALAMVFLAFQGTFAGVLVGWCLVQASLNAMQAALTAGVPDHVPVRQRGEVSGWIGVPQTLGVVAAVLLVTVVVTGVRPGYLVIAALIPLCALPFVLTTPDHPLPAEHRRRFDPRGLVRLPRFGHDFAWAWVTRFLMQLGNALALLYLLYFLTDAVGYERLFPGQDAGQGLLVLILIYTVAVVATTVVAGIVSDRLGRRRALVTVSGLISAVALLMLALWPLWPVAMAAAAIMGVGFGVYLSVDNALVTEVLPEAAGRAKDLGVINVASTGPQVLAPAVAGPIVTGLGGYPVLYATAAALAVLGAVLVRRIRSVR
ncbi:MFS transporter [Microtetraspora sp. NBRC 13810]|uniref:MFS transporter n=1 Tax=Microtetraspora sp. NBRC 13810 TaxID=3030990 RepID=UPI00249FA5C9|nr:MFS transporter [Microtetraspora sp. NBRC 13810]GLW07794.1 MFS transporter [Microtetraspora sp. NBRC 13810]